MIHIVDGDGDFEKERFVQTQVEEHVAKFGNHSVEKYDASEDEIEHIFDAIYSTSLLTPNKCIIVRDIQANPELAERCLSEFTTIPSSVHLILILKNPDRRKSFIKKFQKLPGYTLIKALDNGALIAWIIREAEGAGGSITKGDAAYLLEVLGTDQMRLFQELHKLTTYNKKITRETIDMLVEPSLQNTIFDLLALVFAGKAQKAIDMYRRLRLARIEPQAIIGMLAWQCSVLGIVSVAGTKSDQEIARDHSLHPFVVQKSRALAHNYSEKGIRALVDRTIQLEVTVKTQSSIRPDDAIEQYLIECATESSTHR